MPTRMEKTATQSIGTTLKKRRVLLESNLCGHPLVGLLRERRLEEVLFTQNEGESANMRMSLRPSKITTVLVVRARGRQKWLERKKTWDRICKL